MFKSIKKFIYKQKQIDALQRKVWKNEIDAEGLREVNKEAGVALKKLENWAKMEEDFIKKIEDSKDIHTFENRDKVKKSKEKLTELTKRVELQKRIISYTPRQKNEIPEIPGIVQMIEEKEVMLLETNKLIRRIKSDF